MTIEVRPAPFEPWQELQQFEAAHDQLKGKAGASAVFVGTMRDFNEGDEVNGMSLEHYPGMTEKHLEKICEEAASRWQLLDTLVIHRVGDLKPADPIVLVAVWSAHRKDAFEASRFIMEDLKSKAPFWKKEQLEEGSRWVEKNTSGY
ncbi:molybdopterin converting factor [Solemya pervernicosa gill symbiont]|uniref:Molybdopterin synthase catalytic subunit n=2 Tax=Gammaproteobacteria incertae sedis TaxID=118884 RepID=A0A1T2L8X3_9GAMM|nr:molybdenum cofactor biosynthesis protein MoaE [Candidatus Reidiella endopervernicosa]OOZ41553.1 molybdopterin converting factor [Solemya pervernicosa gill symbiont]QKQ27961.1 molybdenum cofactor biosynthesis protein MoaE [Candidatus Reidiella endopervernicosa]